jgi:phosphoserine phosphatase
MKKSCFARYALPTDGASCKRLVMQTICFDLDGTLTDPKVGITQSIRYALTELTGAAPAAEELTWCA